MESAKTRTVKMVPQEKVVVTIDKDKNYYVGNDMVNIHLLGGTVLNRFGGAADQPVYIRCEESVNFGTFVQVVDALKEAKLTNLIIVTEPLETKRSGP
jgi:biopolymer transport protein ExbD